VNDKRDSVQQLIAISFISAAIFCFETSLTRIIAIQHWHHLIPIIIAIALLGFGIAGSLTATYATLIKQHLQKVLKLSALGTLVLIPVSVAVSQCIPFNMQALPWHWQQSLYLLLYAGCFLLPFLSGALYLTVTFMSFPQRISYLYCGDLLGAAIGGIVALLLINKLSLQAALLGSISLVSLALCLHMKRTRSRLLALGCVIFFALLIQQKGWLVIEATEFKELPIRMSERGAELHWQKDNSLARLSIFESDSLHSAPGLSINSSAEPPRQWRIYKDADQSNAMLLDAGNIRHYELFHQLLGSAPYLISEVAPSVLILAGDYSWRAWTAHWNHARSIKIIDHDNDLLDLFRQSSNQLPTDRESESKLLPPKAKTLTQGHRAYMQQSKSYYDLIQIDSASSRAGVAAAKADYRFTYEGITAAFERLTPEGLLVIHSQVLPVPRDNLRLINSLIKVGQDQQLDSSQHLVVMRDWQNLQILFTKRPLSVQQIDALRSWSEKWAFDLEALPGLNHEQSNRFHIKNEGGYYDEIQNLLSEQANDFINDYLFDLQPTKDNSPFFYHAFHLQNLKPIQQKFGQEWPLAIGWGYLLSVLALLLLSVFAFVFIFLPLLTQKLRLQNKSIAAPTAVYFSSIGCGFMFIEIGLLEKALLLFDSPTETFVIIVIAILVGAGCGSYLLKQFNINSRIMFILAMGIGMIAMLSLFWLEFIFSLSVAGILKKALTMLSLASLSIAMGFFLPFGISRIKYHGNALVAWAWGINGFASILGALAAPLVLMNGGFSVLMVAAAGLYFLGGVCSYFLIPPDSKRGFSTLRNP